MTSAFKSKNKLSRTHFIRETKKDVKKTNNPKGGQLTKKETCSSYKYLRKKTEDDLLVSQNQLLLQPIHRFSQKSVNALELCVDSHP